MTAWVDTGVIPSLTLQQRLRIARENAGMEQADIARLLHRHRVSIARYETGRAIPDVTFIWAWAGVTNVNRTWLETGEPGPEDPGPGIASYTATDLNCEPADLPARHLRVAA